MLGDGIGRACSIAFAKDGAKGIVIADINLHAAREVAALCVTAATAKDFRADAIHVDVTIEKSVKLATAQVIALFQRIDYCVNCAGVSTVPLAFLLATMCKPYLVF
jgi:NAD(P)-dependent dehydrogenase (short-subunit alcohol dehydrogenase family)